MPAFFISVVIPVYNEEKNILAVVKDHAAVLTRGHPFVSDWEIVCLDDASTDKSLSILQRACADYPRLKVVRHSENRGITLSFMDLFQAAKGDYVYATGGDGQWPAQNLSRLLDAARDTSADLVVGVRANRSSIYGMWRLFLSYGFNALSRLFFGVHTRDANGIKLGRREIFNMPVRSRSYFGEIERIIEARKKGRTVAFTPVVFLARAGGKARGARWNNIWATFRDFIKYWMRSIFARSNR